MTEPEPPGFLARWSRRKRAEAAPAPPPAEPESPPATPVETAPGCPIPNGPTVDLASLPRIEELTTASDLGPFLRPGVPGALRDAALRRMWSLDPAIRDYIGPVDYQWDFNTPGGLPFGFANELVGDIARLLDQAIGAAPPEPQPAAPPLRVEQDAPKAEPEAEPAIEPPLAQAALPMPAPVPVRQPALAPVRRHGRALPQTRAECPPEGQALASDGDLRFFYLKGA
jgi:hypothetical protein